MISATLLGQMWSVESTTHSIVEMYLSKSIDIAHKFDTNSVKPIFDRTLNSQMLDDRLEQNDLTGIHTHWLHHSGGFDHDRVHITDEDSLTFRYFVRNSTVPDTGLNTDSDDSWLQILPVEEFGNFFDNPEDYSYDHVIVADTRFRFQFTDRHIIGAKSIANVEDLQLLYSKYINGHTAVVFYGDTVHTKHLMRILRNYDEFRRFDETYSFSPFRDIFLLEGNYRTFLSHYPDRCIGISTTTLKRSTSLYNLKQ